MTDRVIVWRLGGLLALPAAGGTSLLQGGRVTRIGYSRPAA